MKSRRAKWDGYGSGPSAAAERRAAEFFWSNLQGAPFDARALASASRWSPATLPDAPIEALDGEGAAEADEGERGVHLPLLLPHAARGAAYDLRGINCILRWANLPPGYSGAVDVVVHFHGYHARHDGMRLQQKADMSGLDLDVAGLTRPSVGLVPHGHAFPARHRCRDRSNVRCSPETWRGECTEGGITCSDGFDFPALDRRAEFLAFLNAGLAAVAAERASSGLSRGRLIVTGHSGGGAQLSKLLDAFKTSLEITAFQFFDATYGGESEITSRDGWLTRALGRDASALAGTSEADWSSYMARSGSHLRLAFIDGTGTASIARNVDAFLHAQVNALAASEPLRAFLRRYYRAQCTVRLTHNEIPRALGGRLLLDAGDRFNGILQDIVPRTAPPSRRPARRRAEEIPLESFAETSPARPGAFLALPSAFLGETGPSANTSPLSQADIDRLARVSIGNARDLQVFFSRTGSGSFTAWYNSQLAGKEPFTRRGHAIRIPDTAAARLRFDQFWDQIPTAYGRPQITLLDFAAVLCIVLNETGGQFEAFPERCGRGRRDSRGEHPGLAYAFDRIEDVKRSYNTAGSNRTAGVLFNDPDYVRAHGQRALAAQLANHGHEFDGAWNGDTFPQEAFGTAEDPAVNGFVMQANFYKFRGRGVIQTTGRESYLKVVEFVQRYRGTSALVSSFRTAWSGLSPDTAATVRTTQDWDRLFTDAEILATGPALHGRRGSVDYRVMDLREAVLNQVPAASGNPAGTAGSIYALGRRVSGRHRYGAGVYRDRVLGLLNEAIALL